MKRILLPPRPKAMEGERERRGSETRAQAGAPRVLELSAVQTEEPEPLRPPGATQSTPCGPHLGAQGLLLQTLSPTVCASRRSGEKSTRSLLRETQAPGGLGARVPHALVDLAPRTRALRLQFPALPVCPAKRQFLKQAWRAGKQGKSPGGLEEARARRGQEPDPWEARAVWSRAESACQHHAGQGRHSGGVLAQATNLRLGGLCWVPGRRSRGMARRPSAWEGDLVLQLAPRGRGGTLRAQPPARLPLVI